MISYLMFVLGIVRLTPFTQASLYLLVSLGLLVSLYCQRRWASQTQPRPNWVIIGVEEGLFLAALLFLAFVRGQEPSIHGLEKYMDFGFINSILRSSHFPPLDMWLSADRQNPNGFPINYYYFGHLTGAVLIKLTGVNPATGYNLILASIFAQAMTLSFSLALNLVSFLQSLVNRVAIKVRSLIGYGLLGSFIVNLAGNLHTIYLFTTGYPPDQPLPFWQIFSGYHPEKYWYPNATRFIPFTIHEFPAYSYVVADLHGHVFDIPFVLFTLAFFLALFMGASDATHQPKTASTSQRVIFNSLLLGFLTAVHYMTNAFDGPIYFLLGLIVFFLLYRATDLFLLSAALLAAAFLLFSFPFSFFFKPFVSGIGLNCSPQFLVRLRQLGPFLFEPGNCQPDPLWMLFVLWGFFWISFVLLFIAARRRLRSRPLPFPLVYLLLLFSFGTVLVIIPEFFYIKDIYPAHFRANTMFKLGYQAFIMMGMATTGVFFLLRQWRGWRSWLGKLLLLAAFVLVFLYPFFAFPGYYGHFNRPPQLAGDAWMLTTSPDDKEVIDYLNRHIKGQPVILEAQGDSYTDYDRISAYTGLPTVAGWWVHEWLWRGSPNIVGSRIDDIVNIYQSHDLSQTKRLLAKYQVDYVIVTPLERNKYPQLYEHKFSQIGKRIFRSQDGKATIYQIN